jgi:SAM-dependent methyltransferase
MEASAYAEFRDLEDKHWWFIGRKNIFGHLLQRLCRGGEPATRRILDLGCGMGGMMEELSRHAEVLGTDISQEALAYCRNRGYRSVFRASGPHLPLPDASLDVICAFDTLEHIPEEQETIRECFRLLKPGGYLFISVPAYQALYTHQDKIVHHQRRYTAGGLARKLTLGGFRVTRASYINFLLFPAILPTVLFIKAKQALRPPRDDDTSSNVSVRIPSWANRLLAGVFSFERHLLVSCAVPVGHSLIAVGRKPVDRGCRP